MCEKVIVAASCQFSLSFSSAEAFNRFDGSPGVEAPRNCSSQSVEWHFTEGAVRDEGKPPCFGAISILIDFIHLICFVSEHR